jgi:hypothetical protein
MYFSRFLPSENILAARKYKIATNQMRDNKNLNETTGIVLVNAVKKIQIRLIYMANDTGCISICLSNPRSYISFKIKIINKPNKSGSVGRYISKPKPGITIDKGTESGANNAIRYTILSNEKMTTSKMARNRGSAFTTIIFLLTIKNMFNKIKPIEMR